MNHISEDELSVRKKYLQKVIFELLKNFHSEAGHKIHESQLFHQAGNMVENLLLYIGADFNLNIFNDNDVIKSAAKLLSEDQLCLSYDEVERLKVLINNHKGVL